MNPENFSGFFSNYQKMIRQLTRTINLPQMEGLVNQLQISQSFANSIPNIDYSQYLPNYTFISESIASQLIDSVSLPPEQFAEDIRNILKTSQLFRQQALVNQAAFNRIHANLIQELEPILDTSNSLRAIYDNIRLTELTTFSSIAQSPALSQLSHNLLVSIQNPRVEFGEGFLGELSTLLTSIANRQTVQIDDEIISEIEVRFADHVRDVKRGRITQEGVAQIIRDVLLLFAFIISLLSLQSSIASGRTLEETQQILIQMNEQIEGQAISLQELERTTDELEPQLESVNENLELTNQHLETLVNLGVRLLPFTEQAGDSSEEVIVLVTKRPSVIRIEPSRSGAIITRIYPNQLVEQIKREKDWVYVEYFDYSEGIPKTGWVYRWNLILLKE